MLRNSIVEVLMQRDNLTKEQAEKAVQEAKDEFGTLSDFEEMYNFCLERFNLEPDYLEDLIMF